MTVALRKRITLEARLRSLDAEFESWREVSIAGKKLEKHNSQIHRLFTQLGAFRDRISAEVVGLDDAGVLARAREMEDKVLEVHRLWGYFRTKFEPRLVDWQAAYLRAADELAWACYRPIQVAAVAAGFDLAAVKEPPLVYLTGGWSPLLLSRDKDFAVEREATLRLVTPLAFTEMTQRLPVPLIGVPWSQVSQAFDATMIGHEVGHAVEDDFGLADELKAAVGRAVPERRKGAWECWTREAFADWYGCLATGPAYVATLLDVIVGDEAEILAERLPSGGKWGRYPTTFLRALLNLAFLEALEFEPESERLREQWPLLDKAHGMKEFEVDPKAIAKTFLGLRHATLGGGSLAGLMRFNRDHQRDAEQVAPELWGSFALSDVGDPARVLFAAGRLAFQSDPRRFVKESIQGKVVGAVLGTIPSGIRTSPADVGAMDATDSERGAALFAYLGSATRPGST